jgi:hypothetical protein
LPKYYYLTPVKPGKNNGVFLNEVKETLGAKDRVALVDVRNFRQYYKVIKL